MGVISNTSLSSIYLFVYLFGVSHRFQHCIGDITTGSWKGRGNQYIQFVRVLYCKLPTNGKQLPAFPLEAMPGTEPRPQRWETRVLLLCHHGPFTLIKMKDQDYCCDGSTHQAYEQYNTSQAGRGLPDFQGL